MHKSAVQENGSGEFTGSTTRLLCDFIAPTFLRFFVISLLFILLFGLPEGMAKSINNKQKEKGNT